MRRSPDDKWWCEACRKTAYGSEGRGWDAIRTILSLPNRTEKVPCRVYECPYGRGYHLTSNSHQETRRGSY